MLYAKCHSYVLCVLCHIIHVIYYMSYIICFMLYLYEEFFSKALSAIPENELAMPYKRNKIIILYCLLGMAYPYVPVLLGFEPPTSRGEGNIIA